MWESARNMQGVFTWLSFVSLTNSMRALFASGSSAGRSSLSISTFVLLRKCASRESLISLMLLGHRLRPTSSLRSVMYLMYLLFQVPLRWSRKASFDQRRESWLNSRRRYLSWAKLVEMCSTCSRLVQMCSNLFKCV